jgi:putative ATP-binding cassette transporter
VDGPTGQIAAVMMLLVMPPLMGLTQGIQSTGQAKVALDQIDELLRKLQVDSESNVDVPAQGTPQQIRTLEARGLTYVYRLDQEAELCVGPVDLVLNRGESLFIAGGNGSGKTTVAKLLCGLYSPASGKLVVDGHTVDDSNRHRYRSHVSAVFGDFCLFEALAGSKYDQLVSADGSLLEQTRLAARVDQSAGLLARVSQFSTGERRRVALLLALIENRPIIILDEFAAEQDPEHKTWFYEQLIPALKARGKIVIVITHDSRFFRCSDFTLMFERGRAPVRIDNRVEPAPVAVEQANEAYG